MRRVSAARSPSLALLGALAALIVVSGLAWFYASGGAQVVQQWALDGQREAQTALAGGLRALRTGETAALAGFLAVCFGYGFFHAVGPGHGKLLIGGYGAATQVGALRLSLVALASSLAQALSAIALIGAGLWLLQLGRAQMTDLAERLFQPLSFGAIALIGLWLAYRGLRGLGRLRQHSHSHDHHHAHDHPHDSAHCATCGHSHAPDPAALARTNSLREVAALIAAVAIRPCTGALFVLVLTAQMGIFGIGILGTLAMALGTASVTIVVAISAVTLRRGVLGGIVGGRGLAVAQPILELSVGLVVAIIAAQFAWSGFTQGL